MRLLLDTHIALWAISDDKRLSQKARTMIGDARNEIFVSVASLWEIAIKFARRRGDANDMPIGSGVADGYFRASGYAILDISAAHVNALETLPELHQDPFDRILLAQAYEMPLRLLTHDKALPPYGDYVLAV